MQKADHDVRRLKINQQALREKLKLIHIDPEKLTESTITRKTYLYSPINGYVSHVYVNIGKYVNPTDVLIELINPSDIHLGLKVFEKDISKLKIGQKVIAYSNHYPDKQYECRIILISQKVNEDHSIEVHCHFDQYDKSLLPGMYMNADIDLNNIDAMTLPEEAVVSFEDKDYIFIQSEDGRYLMRPVFPGLRENKLIEIKNAESYQNNKIVIKGSYGLLMALKNKDVE